MKSRHFLSIVDLEIEEVRGLVQMALDMKKAGPGRPLAGKTVAMIFEKPSLRTRVSFAMAVHDLGGREVYLVGEEVGLDKREPAGDIARVLSRWVDVIVARVFSHDALTRLAHHASVPVVNALSDLEHPCQAMADILTIYEKKGRFEDVKIAFLGDGNNVAASLVLASSSVGADFVIASPDGYEIPSSIWTEALGRCASTGATIARASSPREAIEGADVVYTDVWVSMGQEEETKRRLEHFRGYQVDENMMELAGRDAIFMHDMPAHRGEEISENMLDHPASVVFDQAENRLHAQKAILAELAGTDEE